MTVTKCQPLSGSKRFSSKRMRPVSTFAATLAFDGQRRLRSFLRRQAQRRRRRCAQPQRERVAAALARAPADNGEVAVGVDGLHERRGLQPVARARDLRAVAVEQEQVGVERRALQGQGRVASNRGVEVVDVDDVGAARVEGAALSASPFGSGTPGCEVVRARPVAARRERSSTGPSPSRTTSGNEPAHRRRPACRRGSRCTHRSCSRTSSSAGLRGGLEQRRLDAARPAPSR